MCGIVAFFVVSSISIVSLQIWIWSSAVYVGTGWSSILREDSWRWGHSCCRVWGQVCYYMSFFCAFKCIFHFNFLPFCILIYFKFSLEDGTVFDSSTSRGAPFGRNIKKHLRMDVYSTLHYSTMVYWIVVFKGVFCTGPFVHGRGQIIQGYTEVLTGRYVPKFWVSRYTRHCIHSD